MKKLVLLVLLSVISVGVAADSAHAIFGGMAWRGHYRRSGYGVFGLRMNKSGRLFRKSASVERKGPAELQRVRVAVDGQIKDWKLLGLQSPSWRLAEDEDDPFKDYRDLK